LTWSRGLDNPRFGERLPSRFLQPVSAAIEALQAERAPAAPEVRKSRLAAIREQLAEKIANDPSGSL